MNRSGLSFTDFIEFLWLAEDSHTRGKLIDRYLDGRSVPIIEGSRVHFLYRGKGKAVSVPSELKSWSVTRSRMVRFPKTNLWYRTETLPINARIEYRMCVDGVWMPDPLNPRRVPGGFGSNSDLRMPEHIVPVMPPHTHGPDRVGSIDTHWIRSSFLRRTHPVFVYTPARHRPQHRLPVLYVLDGGEYLEFAGLHRILDSLIWKKRIRPIFGVFVDPRTVLADRDSSRRMTEYAANEKFLDYLQKEVHPVISARYAVLDDPQSRLILGASMGGLCATYLVLTRPEFIAHCAAQSPAYHAASGVIMKYAARHTHRPHDLFITAGTIDDTHDEARIVADSLTRRGHRVRYIEVPEGHNWSNWRARLPEILEHFFRRTS
jgi:enterochelin esterase-like enzyme